MITENLTVVTVHTKYDQTKILNRIHANLLKEGDLNLIVERNQGENKIKVFHNIGDGIKVLIRTYLVLNIPITVDLSILTGLSGSITFCLDETIELLTSHLKTLQSMQGHIVRKGNNNEQQALEKLDRILCRVDGKH
jgi:hypothetical protein